MTPPYNNFTKAGFEDTEIAFIANFEEELELGAQFCAYQNGELLVDLKGGWTDRQKQSLVNDQSLFSVYSSGKAIAAIAIALLVDQDKIGYDQLLTTFWPEFGQNGKDGFQILTGQPRTGMTGIIPALNSPRKSLFMPLVLPADIILLPSDL